MDTIFRGAAGSGKTEWTWIHGQTSDQTERTLIADVEIPDEAVWALLEEDTQPRARQIGEVTVLILRGINQLSGADPEDMISLRLAVTRRRIVSLEKRRLRQIDEMIAAFEAGQPPGTPDGFVSRLIEDLQDAAEPVLDRLEGQLVRLERASIERDGSLTPEERGQLPDLRQDIILLHRFIAPQAVAVAQLARIAPEWLSSRAAIEEEAENFQRIAADLEALRQRAQLVAEQMALAATDRTNRIVMLLSVISAVFLPLTFLTGLVGVNLDGIPFAGHPLAFTAFCALLVGVGVVSWVLAMRLVR